MADTPETPPSSGDEKPVRRRATRRAPVAPVAPPIAEAKATRGRVAKPASAEAAPVKVEPSSTDRKPKPRGTKRAAPAAKPQPRKSARRAPAKSTTERVRERVGGRWGAAAIAGGLAATGAVVAALFSVRSSTPKAKAAKGVPAPTGTPEAASASLEQTKPDLAKHNGAHQADGTDSSRSFAAGIADEGTVPN